MNFKKIAVLFLVNIFLCLLIGLAFSGTVQAKQAIAKVISAKGVVYAQMGEQKRKLKRRSRIFQDDTILTNKNASIQLRFTDGALIALDEESQFAIAEYSFEKNNSDKVTFELLEGKLRTITGRIGKKNKKNYQMKTPVATIGIRGTHYVLNYCQSNCEVKYKGQVKQGLYGGVYEGSIWAKNSTGDISFDKDDYFYVSSLDAIPETLLIVPQTLQLNEPINKTSLQSKKAQVSKSTVPTRSTEQSHANQGSAENGSAENPPPAQNTTTRQGTAQAPGSGSGQEFGLGSGQGQGQGQGPATVQENEPGSGQGYRPDSGQRIEPDSGPVPAGQGFGSAPGKDIIPDQGPDMGPDSGPDFGPDHGPDMGPDSGPDFGPDHGPDMGPDSGPDFGPDMGPDSGPDFGPDHGPDMGPDSGPDFGPDMGPDSGPDFGPDHGPDMGPDSGPDFGPDMGPDSGPDFGPDMGPDSGPDFGPDMGPDSGPDFGPDMGPDSGPDFGPDMGPDSGPDFGPDMGPDSGPDFGPDMGPDSGPDFGPDMGPLPGPDLGPDSGPDMGPLPGTDMGPDSGPDMGPLPGPDLGPDLGPDVGPLLDPDLEPDIGPDIGPLPGSDPGATNDPIIDPILDPGINPDIGFHSQELSLFRLAPFGASGGISLSLDESNALVEMARSGIEGEITLGEILSGPDNIIVRIENNFSPCSPCLNNIENAVLLDRGGDPLGVNWGRWNGDVSLEDEFGVFALNNTNMHYIYNGNVTPPNALPTSGLFFFNYVGGTIPTSDTGSMGNILPGTGLMVDFSTFTMDARINVGIDGTILNATGGTTFSGSEQTFIPLQGSCIGCSENNLVGGELQTQFVGDHAEGAAGPFSIISSDGSVSGVLFMKR